MIEKTYAAQIYSHSLKAIAELSTILEIMKGKCSEQEYEQCKKAVGLSIGKIQMDILEPINAIYPELDDLK